MHKCKCTSLEYLRGQIFLWHSLGRQKILCRSGDSLTEDLTNKRQSSFNQWAWLHHITQWQSPPQLQLWSCGRAGTWPGASTGAAKPLPLPCLCEWRLFILLPAVGGGLKGEGGSTKLCAEVIHRNGCHRSMTFEKGENYGRLQTNILEGRTYESVEVGTVRLIPCSSQSLNLNAHQHKHDEGIPTAWAQKGYLTQVTEQYGTPSFDTTRWANPKSSRWSTSPSPSISSLGECSMRTARRQRTASWGVVNSGN